MQMIRVISFATAGLGLCCVLAGCESSANSPTAISKKPLPPPTPAQLQQRSAEAEAAFDKAMASPSGHPPANNPVAVAAFHAALRNVYGAPGPGAPANAPAAAPGRSTQ